MTEPAWNEVDASGTSLDLLDYVGVVTPTDGVRDTQFGHGAMPAGFTFVQNATANATHDNSGESSQITIPAGVTTDTIYDLVSTDDTAGLVTDLPVGDFDVMFRLSSTIGGDNSSGIGFILRGADDTDMIRWGLYSDTEGTWMFGYGRAAGAGVNFQVPLPIPVGDWLLNHPSWLRAQRIGSGYGFYLSGDGVNWKLLSSHTNAAHAPATVKLFIGQTGPDLLGLTHRVDEFVDRTGETADARPAPAAHSQGTTQTSTLDTLPAWLTLHSDGDGAATIGGGQVVLTTAPADTSGGRLLYNGDGYYNAGLLCSSWVTGAYASETYHVHGLAAVDGPAGLDTYVSFPTYLLEINSNDGSQIPVRAIRPLTLNAFNEPYTFLGSATTPVGPYIKQWTRVEKINTRLRMRRWDDNVAEPSVWDFDGEEDALRGAGLLVPYSCISHNPGYPSGQSLHIDDYEFYEITIDMILNTDPLDYVGQVNATGDGWV